VIDHVRQRRHCAVVHVRERHLDVPQRRQP
jgi:hypothetical protein